MRLTYDYVENTLNFHSRVWKTKLFLSYSRVWETPPYVKWTVENFRRRCRSVHDLSEHDHMYSRDSIAQKLRVRAVEINNPGADCLILGKLLKLLVSQFPHL